MAANPPSYEMTSISGSNRTKHQGVTNSGYDVEESGTAETGDGIHLGNCQPTCLRSSPSVCLPACMFLSVCLSTFLSVCLYVCLSVFV